LALEYLKQGGGGGGGGGGRSSVDGGYTCSDHDVYCISVRTWDS